MKEMIKRLLDEFPDHPAKKMTDSGSWILTDVGIWVPARTEHLLDLFKKIRLERHRNFIDLGSGDGRVVAAAALFGVQATGIEYDTGLHFVSIRKMQHFPEINRGIKLIKGNYHDYDISGFDMIFVHGDGHVPEELRQKLEYEMRPGAKALFYIYHPQLPGTATLNKKIPVWLYEKKS
ncbi:MAG: class I SAM-dependent methyltransferase [Candidatus Aenigmarchaeota archaeon]|nr:class I SAM-dependent methyltransferase [Candidatus Aenigmarchaeota archaeon]